MSLAIVVYIQEIYKGNYEVNVILFFCYVPKSSSSVAAEQRHKNLVPCAVLHIQNLLQHKQQNTRSTMKSIM